MRRQLKQILIKAYGVYAVLVVTLWVLGAGVVVLLLPGMSLRRRVARMGLRGAFFCAGMPFAVHRQQRWPDGPCVVAANHRSYLDGLVLVAALPVRFTPVIKAEVSAIPIIRTVLRRIGARYVRREPARWAGSDTRDLLGAIDGGESLAVFPEGTFSVDEGLLPFRDGATFLASQAGVPVIPVAIQGTNSVLPPGRMLPRPAAVRICILEALCGDGTGRQAAQTLRDRTEQSLWHGLKPRASDRPGRAPDYDYYCTVLANHSLPQAFLDLDLLEHNIRTVLDRSGGKRLRVDARTLRCPAVIDRVLRSHIRFHGVKCATGFEAVYLARTWELDDILVAYPTMQRGAAAHVCAAVADGCDITMVADSGPHLSLLAMAARDADIVLPICVEMDLSPARGSNRSNLRTPGDLATMLDAVDAMKHLRFRGVLAFDTQRKNVPPWFTMPRGRYWLTRWMDSGAQRRLHERRRKISEVLEAHGCMSALFNGGGAGGIELNAADSSITEITVGASLFAADMAIGDGHQPPAAGLALEVMRRPGHDTYVCLGGGYTATDTTVAAALPQPYLPPGAVLKQSLDAGEAHIPIHYAGELGLGDIVFLRSPNAGELCERFSTLLLVQGGNVVGEALTYRGLGEQMH